MSLATAPVRGIIILDSDGQRVCAKYYHSSLASHEKQASLEKRLHKKAKGMSARTETEIVLMDGLLAVFRKGLDITLLVVGAEKENEIMLANVLDGFYNATSTILRGHMEKRAVLDGLDSVLLAADEVTDGGVIMETDPVAIVNRVVMQGPGAARRPSEWASLANSARDTFIKAFTK